MLFKKLKPQLVTKGKLNEKKKEIVKEKRLNN
jgi:hypothetical protein